MKYSDTKMDNKCINPFATGIPSTLQYTRDNECAPLHFSSVALKKTALASYPGSGNTWHRHLIQQLTGAHGLNTDLF